ncbi:MAG: hypothetical protein ACREJM_16435, partial [Candidatus Saccharimonadales bacterium]
AAGRSEAAGQKCEVCIVENPGDYNAPCDLRAASRGRSRLSEGDRAMTDDVCGSSSWSKHIVED